MFVWIGSLKEHFSWTRNPHLFGIFYVQLAFGVTISYIWLGLNERLFQGKVSGVFVLLFISKLRTSFIVILDGSCFMLNEISWICCKPWCVLLNEKLFVSYMWSTATITAIALAHGGVSPYYFKFFFFFHISFIARLAIWHWPKKNWNKYDFRLTLSWRFSVFFFFFDARP